MPSSRLSRRWLVNRGSSRNETWRTHSRCCRFRHSPGGGGLHLHDGQRQRRAAVPQVNQRRPANPAALFRLEHRGLPRQGRPACGLRFPGRLHPPHGAPEDGPVRDRASHPGSSGPARQLDQRLRQRDRCKGGARRALQDRLRRRPELQPLPAAGSGERGAACGGDGQRGVGQECLRAQPAVGSLHHGTHRFGTDPVDGRDREVPRSELGLSAHFVEHPSESPLPRGCAAHQAGADGGALRGCNLQQNLRAHGRTRHQFEVRARQEGSTARQLRPRLIGCHRIARVVLDTPSIASKKAGRGGRCGGKPCLRPRGWRGRDDGRGRRRATCPQHRHRPDRVPPRRRTDSKTTPPSRIWSG